MLTDSTNKVVGNPLGAKEININIKNEMNSKLHVINVALFIISGIDSLNIYITSSHCDGIVHTTEQFF